MIQKINLHSGVLFATIAMTLLVGATIFFTHTTHATQEIEFRNGMLITTNGTDKIFIVQIHDNTVYRREVLDRRALSAYANLQYSNIVVVDHYTFNQFVPSNLLLEVDGYGNVIDGKVYALSITLRSPVINKHHLNITPQEFEQLGLQWGAIYKVNTQEMTLYQEAPSMDVATIQSHLLLPEYTTTSPATSAYSGTPPTYPQGAVSTTINKQPDYPYSPDYNPYLGSVPRPTASTARETQAQKETSASRIFRPSRTLSRVLQQHAERLSNQRVTSQTSQATGQYRSYINQYNALGNLLFRDDATSDNTESESTTRTATTRTTRTRILPATTTTKRQASSVSTTTTNTAITGYYTSRQPGHRYYYPSNCEIWKTIAPNNRVLFESISTLRSYYDRTKHPSC